MNVESHLRNLKESLEEIKESIQKGVVNRQRTIGFHTSAAASDMLEVFLHKKNLISPGQVIKHEWLKSKNKINEKLAFDFAQKDEIIKLMHSIEERRNQLCYGKPSAEKEIESQIEDFNKLKEIFIKGGLNEIK